MSELCKYLRVKTDGAHGDPRALERAADDASTVYWCLLTMSSAGPDDGLVHAHGCRAGRKCCATHDGVTPTALAAAEQRNVTADATSSRST